MPDLHNTGYVFMYSMFRPLALIEVWMADYKEVNNKLFVVS